MVSTVQLTNGGNPLSEHDRGRRRIFPWHSCKSHAVSASRVAERGNESEGRPALVYAFCENAWTSELRFR